MRIKIKRKTFYIISILLIFFFAIILYIKYISSTSNKLKNYANTYYKEYLNNNLNKKIIELIASNKELDILNIYRNANDEILYVDYNLKDVYKILNEVASLIKSDENLKNRQLKVPFLAFSNNAFYNFIGPKVIININYIDAAFANIYTKVTDYGLNNALLEVYIKLNVTSQIISPGVKEQNNNEYSFLIASKVINGKVPSFFGNSLMSSSQIISVPFEK